MLGCLATLALLSGGGVVAQTPPPPPPEPVAPPIQVLSPRRFLVALGERLRFPNPPLAPLPEQARSPVASWQNEAKAWWVQGDQAGSYRFRWGNQDIEILVQERSLKLPKDFRVTTFGGYDLGVTLKHLLRDYLHPRARLQIQGSQIQASGTDLIPLQVSLTPAQILTAEVTPHCSESLILSNWPEKVEQDQVLLDQEVTADSRVMIHHRNAPEQPLRWLEEEIVAGDQPLTLAISSFLAGPSQDEIFAGHLAAIGFFRGNRSGYLVSLQPHQRHLIERAVLKPAQTVSIMQLLQALPAPWGGARLRVVARQPENAQELPTLALDPKARTTRGQFAPDIARELHYQAGGSYLFEDLGGPPYLKEVRLGHPSPGNFGSVYRYRLVLENPGPADQEFRLELSARGGPARACLWLDGQPLETDLLKAEPRVLKRWTVAAGTNLTVPLETFPQAGSNYPLNLSLSSRSLTTTNSTASPAAEPGWFIP